MGSASLADVAIVIIRWQVVALVAIGVTCAIVAVSLALGCAWTIAKDCRRLTTASPPNSRPS